MRSVSVERLELTCLLYLLSELAAGLWIGFETFEAGADCKNLTLIELLDVARILPWLLFDLPGWSVVHFGLTGRPPKCPPLFPQEPIQQNVLWFDHVPDDEDRYGLFDVQLRPARISALHPALHVSCLCSCLTGALIYRLFLTTIFIAMKSFSYWTGRYNPLTHHYYDVSSTREGSRNTFEESQKNLT